MAVRRAQGVADVRVEDAGVHDRDAAVGVVPAQVDRAAARQRDAGGAARVVGDRAVEGVDTPRIGRAQHQFAGRADGDDIGGGAGVKHERTGAGVQDAVGRERADNVGSRCAGVAQGVERGARGYRAAGRHVVVHRAGGVGHLRRRRGRGAGVAGQGAAAHRHIAHGGGGADGGPRADDAGGVIGDDGAGHRARAGKAQGRTVAARENAGADREGPSARDIPKRARVVLQGQARGVEGQVHRGGVHVDAERVRAQGVGPSDGHGSARIQNSDSQPTQVCAQIHAVGAGHRVVPPGDRARSGDSYRPTAGQIQVVGVIGLVTHGLGLHRETDTHTDRREEQLTDIFTHARTQYPFSHRALLVFVIPHGTFKSLLLLLSQRNIPHAK